MLNLFTDYKFNHNVNFEKGILEDECKNLLQEFFKKLRKQKSGTKEPVKNKKEKSMANQRFSKKILNICIICIIIVAIIFTAVMLILNYDEKGETNMPFKVSKISIVSTVNGQDVENSEAKWDINVIQNNDVYIYIEKNDDYKKQETIKNVKLENITIAGKTRGWRD